MTQDFQVRIARILDAQLCQVEDMSDRQRRERPAVYFFGGFVGAAAIVLAPLVIKHLLS